MSCDCKKYMELGSRCIVCQTKHIEPPVVSKPKETAMTNEEKRFGPMSAEEKEMWVGFLNDHEVPAQKNSDYRLPLNAFLKAIRMAQRGAFRLGCQQGAAEQRAKTTAYLEKELVRYSPESYGQYMDGYFDACRDTKKFLASQAIRTQGTDCKEGLTGTEQSDEEDTSLFGAVRNGPGHAV